MTVFATAYSSIDEAWGESYLSPTLQKKQKKKKSAPQSDPICDLYENAYSVDNDIVSYANKYFDRHEKEKYQPPRMKEREASPKVVTFGDGPMAPYNSDVKEDLRQFMRSEEEQEENHTDDRTTDRYIHYEAAAEDSTPPQQTRHLERYNDYNVAVPRTKARDRVLYDTHENYVGDENPDFYKRNANFNYFDVVLYIISGVILIFLMEQFVKVGMLMHQ